MPVSRTRLKQHFRRLPGAGVAQERIPQLLRRSRAFRAIVRRAYAVDGSVRAPVDVAAGRVLHGSGTESLPVVLIVMLDADESTIDGTVDEVARIQLLSGGFRPVFATDTPAFAAMRRLGYPAELLIPANEWTNSEMTWQEYARRTLALMFDGYQATASVTLGAEGLNSAARSVLGSLRRGS